jgi:hypothetical protein
MHQSLPAVGDSLLQGLEVRVELGSQGNYALASEPDQERIPPGAAEPAGQVLTDTTTRGPRRATAVDPQGALIASEGASQRNLQVDG